MKTKIILIVIFIGLFYSCKKTTSSTTLNNGLIAYYPFNGNANDESGNRHNGTVYGATLTTDRFGNSNKAYNFDGSGSCIQVIDSSFALKQYTISMWVSINSQLSDGETSMLISIGNYGGDQHLQYTNDYYSLYGWTFGGYNVDSLPYTLSVGALPNVNQWYLLTVTRSADKLDFFINGLLTKSESSKIPILPNYGTGKTIAIIGAHFNYTMPFNGKIDEVRIYNRILSNNEITELKNLNQ